MSATVTVPLFRPFAGLRPAAGRAADVAAPPYDVLNTEEARVLAEGKPFSFLHISKPEIDLPEDTDQHAPEVYAKGAENLKKMVEAGVLIRDAQPVYYAYRLKMGDHVQTGVVAGAAVADYDTNRIRKHEFTRPDKEDDRVRQIDAVDAQTGPVLLAYRPIAEVAAILKAVTAGAPAYDIVAHDGIGHTLWLIDRAEWIEGITRAFAAQKAVYIADGHHRSAAASRVAAARRQADAGARGDALHESFLTVAFPSDEMRILDYNRVVRDLNGLSPQDFLAHLENAFTVVPVSGQARPDGVTVFGLYLSGQWYRLELKRKPDSGMDPVERLDVSLLTDHVLTPILGIADLRKDKRIDFVGGRRGLDELEKRVNSGEMAAAFALWPTSLDDLFAVADADKVMPPKSTWFEPKLADGLISYPLR